MPRGPRLDAAGVLHHVMVGGLERRAVFREDRDRTDFVHRLAAQAVGLEFTVYAWAPHRYHAHLLERTGGYRWRATCARSSGPEARPNRGWSRRPVRRRIPAKSLLAV